MNVDELMSTNLITVSEDTTLADVRTRLETHKVHHVLVREDGGRIVGILSARDVARNLSPFLGKLSEQARDRDTLRTRAHQVMTHGVVTVAQGTLIRDAAKRILENNVSSVGVHDPRGQVVGIVTWRDLIRALAAEPEPTPEPGEA